MTARGIELESLARQVEVDPKTVQRWIGGRVPHPRHRWKICDLLGQAEEHLWPGVGLGASGTHHTSEIVAALGEGVDESYGRAARDWLIDRIIGAMERRAREA